MKGKRLNNNPVISTVSPYMDFGRFLLSEE